MATTPIQVSVEEYLHTVYKPDCDYVDGELEERAVGEYDHSTWQAILLMYFGARQMEWGVKVRPELRIKIAPRRYRVPDVCLLSRNAPIEQVVTYPPLAVFEVLSPEDRMTRVMGRLADFDSIGVGAIWLIDPRKSSYSIYSSGHLTPATRFELPGTDFRAEMSEIAAMVD
jgi:Uma2 family endonuclease